MKRVAVILSGCGYLDGAEIRESVLALLYLDQAGAKVEIFAPDIDQYHVVDHLSGNPTKESRNVLKESARIARSKIKPLQQLHAVDFDALVLPGGYGVAKNLSDFAFKGKDASVEPDFARVVTEFYQAQKPIGAICIAPAVLAVILQSQGGATVTIGEDAGTAAAITACGSTHEICDTEDFVYDPANKIASCSAYMREDSIAKVAQGIEKVVKQVLSVA
jgi:enhancing lycopene biosynthesis protein 2